MALINSKEQLLEKISSCEACLAAKLDGSNGKALNKFVKANQYEYKRIDDSDLTLINEELEKLTKTPETINENTQETTS
jgi:hypothetical protein